MTNTTIFMVISLVELLIIMSGVTVYMFIKMRRLAAITWPSISTQTDTPDRDPLPELFAAIIELTSRQLARETRDLDTEKTLIARRVLAKRIEFLRSEIDALSDDRDSDSYWTNIYQRLKPLFDADTAQQPKESGGTELDDVESLQRTLAFQAERIERLAVFKQKFMELRGELNHYKESAQALATALPKSAGESGQSPEFLELVKSFQQREDQLQYQLLLLEGENKKLDDGLSHSELEAYTLGCNLKEEQRKNSDDAVTAVTVSTERIDRLKNIVDSQYSAIDELRHSLMAAIGDQGDTTEIEQRVQEIEAGRDELKMCVEVLEMENSRLMDLLSHKRLAAPDDQDTGHDEITVEPDDKDDKDGSTGAAGNNDLRQSLDEKEELIGRLASTNREQKQCIEILESRMQSLEDGEDKVVRAEHEKLQHEVVTLKQKLTSKDQELIKLREQYAQLETEFLAVSISPG